MSIAVLLPTFLSKLAAASAQCADPYYRPEAVTGQHLAQTSAVEWASTKAEGAEKPATSRGFCTRHYDPVCAKSEIGEVRTFGNRCEAESADWKVIGKGLCEISTEKNGDGNKTNP